MIAALIEVVKNLHTLRARGRQFGGFLLKLANRRIRRPNINRLLQLGTRFINVAKITILRRGKYRHVAHTLGSLDTREDTHLRKIFCDQPDTLGILSHAVVVFSLSQLDCFHHIAIQIQQHTTLLDRDRI